jgi:thiosulfate dehydrogenase [quinone] large subunit
VSHTNFAKYVTLYLRLALAAAYLSSVADRFGLWGAEVGWGNFANFLDYTAKLNPFLPLSFIPAIGWIATILETSIAVFLILGFRIRETALVSGSLLILFAIGMSVGLGVKSPLDYSVFTASAASFLLAIHHRGCFLCVDSILSRNSREQLNA